jgi:hypothetical protein
MPDTPVNLSIDPEALRPLIAEVVAQTLAALDADRGRLAYSEAEAARMLGLNPHQLRDERLRGRITATQIVGKRIRYTKADLQAYLDARRTGA